MPGLLPVGQGADNEDNSVPRAATPHCDGSEKTSSSTLDMKQELLTDQIGRLAFPRIPDWRDGAS